MLGKKYLAGMTHPVAGVWAACSRLGLAEFGVQHEQKAKMVRVLRWLQPERPPESGHAVQAFPAERAFLAEVDRSVGRCGEDEYLGVLGGGWRGQSEAVDDGLAVGWRAAHYRAKCAQQLRPDGVPAGGRGGIRVRAHGRRRWWA